MSAITAGPCGNRIVLRYAPSRHSSTPGTAVATRCPNRLSGHSGSRNGSRTDKAVPARTGPAFRAAAGQPRVAAVRWALGEHLRTVSLNVRTLENPAANATSAMGNRLVSISTRAVCARCARAMASGPTPSSATSWRSICRTL